VPDPTDPELVRRALAGDDAAFTQLAARHKAWLYRFIRRYVGQDDEALDLLQDSLVSTWLSLDRYDPQRPFTAWLRQIALNKCRDWSRRGVIRRIVRYVSGDLESLAGAAVGSDPEALLSTDEALRRLDQAVSALPLGLREPLILNVFEGLSHRETAQQLGLSEKAVELRIYRARQRLAATVDRAGLTDLIEDKRP
jgi:RNA polymerase sigma factor CnrH